MSEAKIFGPEKQRDTFGEFDLGQYAKIVAWPFVVAVLLLIGIHRSDPTPMWWQLTLVYALYFAVIVFLAFQRFSTSSQKFMILCGAAGVGLGLYVAVLDWFNGFAFYKAFELITEPATFLVIGLGIGWAARRFGRSVRFPLLLHHRKSTA